MLNTWGLNFNCVHEVHSSYFLPFLYQTRTLFARSRHPARLGQRTKHSRRSYSKTPAPQQAFEDQTTGPRSNKLDTTIRKVGIAEERPGRTGCRRVRLPTTERDQPRSRDSPPWDSPFPLYRTVAKQRPYQKSVPPSTLHWNDVNPRKPALSATPKEAEDDRGKSEYGSRTNIRNASVPGSGLRTSTMTASEKAVFEKIYNDITRSSANGADQPEDSRLEDEDELLARDQLSNLFEDAISLIERHPQIPNVPARSQSTSGERVKDVSSTRQSIRDINNVKKFAINESAKSYDAQYIASNVSRDAGELIGLDTEVSSETTADMASDHVNPMESQGAGIAEIRAVRDYTKVVDGMFERAQTDVEVWDVLQKEVFSLIGQLNKQNELEEKAQKAQKLKARKLKKKTKAKAKAAADLQEVIGASLAADEEKQLPPTSGDSQDSIETLSSKSLKKNTLMHILRETYASNCVKALRIFRRRFPSTPYSLHLLSHLKSLGSLSYVLGATSSVYDEVLFQKWNQYADVQGLADTMEEMYNHGVPPTSVTVSLLRLVSRIRTSELNGEDGEVAKTWWQLRSVAEGWSRVKKFYDYFKLHMPAEESSRTASSPDERAKPGMYAAKHYPAHGNDNEGRREESSIWPYDVGRQQHRNESMSRGLRDREISDTVIRPERSADPRSANSIRSPMKVLSITEDSSD